MKLLAPFGLVGAVLAAAPALGAQSPDLRAVEVQRIGSLDGPDALTAVTGAVVVDGRLVVGQPREWCLRVIEPDGSVRTLGRSGEGPGEFMDVSDVGFEGERITVFDRELHRTTTLDLDGTVLSTEPVPSGWFSRATGTGWAARFAAVGGRAVYSGDDRSNRDSQSSDNVAPLIVARGGVPQDTLPPWPYRDQAIMVEYGGRRTVLQRPIHTGVRLDASPDGRTLFYVDGIGGVLVVRAVDLVTGDSTVVRFAAPEVEVPRAWVDSLTRVRSEAYDRAFDAATAARFREAAVLPARIPQVDHVVATSSTEVWVRIPRFDGEDPVWRVVDVGEGTQRFVSIPAGIDLLARDGDALWGETRDAFDVTYLVRMTLEPAAR